MIRWYLPTSPFDVKTHKINICGILISIILYIFFINATINLLNFIKIYQSIQKIKREKHMYNLILSYIMHISEVFMMC